MTPSGLVRTPRLLACAAAFAIALSAAPASAQQAISPEYRKDLNELAQSMNAGTAAIMQALTPLIDQVVQKIAASNPGKEQNIRKITQEEFSAAVKRNMPAVVDANIEIFARHFTQEDVKAMVAFYRTPTGKKYIEKLPAITKDLLESAKGPGQQMANDALNSTVQRLHKEGYAIPSGR